MDYLQKSNEEWLEELRRPSPGCSTAIDNLRGVLLRGLTAAFRKSNKIDHHSIEDFAQEALIKIMDNLDTFKGESAFTTWSMKIAVNHTITQLRRKRWEDVSLDSLPSPEAVVAPGKLIRLLDGPEKRMMKRELAAMVNAIIAAELTENQRKVMEVVMIHGMPLEEAAERLNTTRNALYKAMHDARKRLKEVLISKGMNKDEILSMLM